jgi:hypothetical protein
MGLLGQRLLTATEKGWSCEFFALYVILEWLSFIILIHTTDILVQCVNMSYISCVLVKDSQ